MKSVGKKNIIYIVIITFFILLYFLYNHQVERNYVRTCDEPTFNKNDFESAERIPKVSDGTLGVSLNNGEYALVLNQKGSGWNLKKGDSLTVTFKNDKSKILVIGLVIDRTMYLKNITSENSEFISREFEANTDGEYAIYILCADTDLANLSAIQTEVKTVP